MEQAIEIEVQKGRKPRRKHRCMFRDAKGRWWLDYYTPDGKRRRKLAGKNKADADRLLREVRSSADRGEYVDATRAPGFSDFCGVYHERHGQHKASSAKSRGRVERLRAHFGNRRLSEISASMIENYRLERIATGKGRNHEDALKLATINREVALLRVMLNKAVKWGLLARNPAAKVEDYDEGEPRERYLQRQEIVRLLRATKLSPSPALRPVVYLELETGLRKSELFGLRWSDVDFEHQQLLVRNTKTGVQRRVPLSRRARWVLAKRAARDPMATWVFESRARDGARIGVSDVKKAWRQALRRAKIEDFRFHDLRHTFASHFAMKGGNIYALAKILGHSNPKMTLDRYAHLSPDFIQEQQQVMDRPTYTATVRANGHQMDTKTVSGAARESLTD